MIVVRIELWPLGDPRPLRQIAILGIVNVGPEPDGRDSYEARFEGRITRLSHDRADGALALVARAIDALANGSEPDPRAARLDEGDLDLGDVAAARAPDGARPRSKTWSARRPEGRDLGPPRAARAANSR
jgi:hypothetical protein